MASSSLTAVTHTGNLNGKPLRFFQPPDGSDDLCWVAWDDLPLCTGLPRAMRRQFLQRLKEEYRGRTRTVATADGITTIAPHFMAQGFLSSMIETGFAPASVEVEYGREMKAAWDAVYAHLSAGVRAQALMAALIRQVREDALTGCGPQTGEG